MTPTAVADMQRAVGALARAGGPLPLDELAAAVWPGVPISNIGVKIAAYVGRGWLREVPCRPRPRYDVGVGDSWRRGDLKPLPDEDCLEAALRAVVARLRFQKLAAELDGPEAQEAQVAAAGALDLASDYLVAALERDDRLLAFSAKVERAIGGAA